jgi:integrase
MGGTVVRVRGIRRWRHPRTGIEYTYHRQTGKRIEEEFGTGDFFKRLAELDAEAKGVAERRARAGTLHSLVLDYRRSEAFKDLKPRTRQDYERVFTFLGPIFDQPLSAFDAATIVALRNRWREARGRRFVNYCLTVLKLVFRHGMDEQLVSYNPVSEVRSIRRDKNAVPLNRPWTAEERAAVWKAVGTPRWRHLRLPVAIGLETGMREGDVIALTRLAIKGRLLSIKTAKRGVDIAIPISSRLAEALCDAESHDSVTLCVNSKGLPWKGNGFRSGFRKMLRALEAEGKIGQGCTFHGFRHDVATRLAEAGCSAEDIAAVLGQKSSRIAAHYADKADRSRRTEAAIRKLAPTTGAKRTSDAGSTCGGERLRRRKKET